MKDDVKVVSSDRIRRVEALVQTHEARLRAYLSYLGCPARQLDDLVQDTFLSVLSADFEERTDASTAAFLRTVARNLLYKALRRERREPPMADPALVESVWVEYESDDRGAGYLDALRECFSALGERASDVLRLRYHNRLGGAAIAGRIGMTEAGVKSILVRSKKKLRGCIERRLRA